MAVSGCTEPVYFIDRQSGQFTMRLRPLILLLALCAALAACGNKGPLVLPDQKPQTQPQQPAATPAPPQDSGKQ